MRRPFAERAEVAGRADDAAAEVVHPDAVDEHAARQRMLAVGQPVRERQPAAGRRQASPACRVCTAAASRIVSPPGAIASFG